LSTPASSGGSVYVTSTDGRLYAVNTNGTERWRSSTSTRVGAPAIAGSIVYSATSTGVEAFDAAGVTHCTGAPTTCDPLWTAPGTASADTPAVANGVLYVGEHAGDLRAFDATGNTNCFGVPKTCSPLWSATAGTFITSSPVVANGAVFVRDNVVSGSYNRNVDAFAIVGPRMYASNNGIGPEFSVQGDHFLPSTAGVVTVTDIDQSNDDATASFTTAADGTFSTSATIPAWRCGDIVHVTAAAGTTTASYQTFVECQI
jgi:outer membrane protein assembly factor BamB